MAENPLQKQEREKRDKEIRELYPKLTLMEIGKKYNLTHQRVHQIKIKVAPNQGVEKLKIKIK